MRCRRIAITAWAWVALAPVRKTIGTPCGGAIRDRLSAGQQDDDPIFRRMLDRDPGEPPCEFARDGVGLGNARLLRLEPTERFLRRDSEPRGILRRILGQAFRARLDVRLCGRGNGEADQCEEEQEPVHWARL